MLCLALAVAGGVFALASHAAIGIGIVVLGLVCALLGAVHLTWARIRGNDG